MITLVRGDRTVTLQQGQTSPVNLSSQPRSVTVVRGGRIVAPAFSFNVTIEGGNAVVTPGDKGDVSLPFRARIVGYMATSGPNVGSYTVDLRKVAATAPSPPGPSDSVETFTVTSRKQDGVLDIECEIKDILGITLTATAVVERISLMFFGERL